MEQKGTTLGHAPETPFPPPHNYNAQSTKKYPTLTVVIATPPIVRGGVKKINIVEVDNPKHIAE